MMIITRDSSLRFEESMNPSVSLCFPLDNRVKLMSDEDEVIDHMDEVEDDDDDDVGDEDDEEEVYHTQSSEPVVVVDVLQIDNELSSTKYRFKKNEIMLCYHGLLLYEVKCVDHKMKENDSGNFHRPFYLVHYCGWSSKWDEWVDETRLVKMDEHGLKKQTQLLQQHGKGKARLKNLRKNNSTSPLKRTTSRSISDYSTSTNVDSITNESTTANHHHHHQFAMEETPSLSGRSDTGSSSSNSSSELISNTDSAVTTNDLTEPEVKKFKRSVHSSGKVTSKEKSTFIRKGHRSASLSF
jgi:hypothetical protein